MIVWLRHLLGWVVSALRSREDLILENLVLRQQLLALHAKRPRRRLTAPQKLFWIMLRRAWDGWKQPLVLVTPRTVVAWHRAGFRLYWKWLSRAQSLGGRRPVSKEIRALIFQMVAENPTWGAPRIHGVSGHSSLLETHSERCVCAGYGYYPQTWTLLHPCHRHFGSSCLWRIR